MKRNQFDSLWKKLRLKKSIGIATREKCWSKWGVYSSAYLMHVLEKSDSISDSPSFEELDTLWRKTRTMYGHKSYRECELRCIDGTLEAQDAMVFIHKFACSCPDGETEQYRRWENEPQFTLLEKHTKKETTHEP